MNAELYNEDLQYIAGLPLPWEKMRGSSLLITGATGMIGRFLADALMFKNRTEDFGCHIYVTGRSMAKLKDRFAEYEGDPLLHLVEMDINIGNFPALPTMDYCIHLASSTHPVQYATDPIGTITANIIGTRNLLEFASSHGCKRFAFASSNEIYGENRGDTELFKEDYCGYIDCNTMRAGYPESKRCGEALCQAYIRQKNMDIVIPRLTRSYGPTLLSSDTKALTQFLHKGLAGEDIVLKIADLASDIRLKDLAGIIAGEAGTRVVFDLPDEVEKAGFSKATKARLDSTKLQGLGWKAKYDIREGIRRTMKMMRA